MQHCLYKYIAYTIIIRYKQAIQTVILNCSDTTAADIDAEITKILKDSYKQAKKLLKENRKVMDKLAAHLIEKETITGKEFMQIFRKEKGIPEPKEEEKKADTVKDAVIIEDNANKETTIEADATEVEKMTPSVITIETVAEKAEETEDITEENSSQEIPKDLRSEEEKKFADVLQQRVYQSHTEENNND